MQTLAFVDAPELERLGRQAGPVLVAFVATWNRRCQAFAPAYRSLAEACAGTHPLLAVVAVDVDECTELTRRFEVCSVPTVMLLQGGRATRRLEDTNLSAVRGWLDAAR